MYNCIFGMCRHIGWTNVYLREQITSKVTPELLYKSRINAIFSKNVYMMAAEHGDVSTRLSAALHKNKANTIYYSLIRIKNTK